MLQRVVCLKSLLEKLLNVNIEITLNMDNQSVLIKNGIEKWQIKEASI